MSFAETIVTFSENETRLLNLKVSRCVSDNFDSEVLSKQITENKYDICRLTVSSSDEDAISKLQKSGLPYYYSGGITRYKTLIADLPDRGFINKNIEYEQYDGTQDELLLKMLVGTWGTYPIGYYRTPFLKQLITKEQEILCVFEFYKKNNHQKNFPNNSIMFMKHNGNYVGFFALNIIEDRLESHIGGILEPYRVGGYFYDTQEFMRTFCLANHLDYFAFGARNENRRVNSIFQKFGYVAIDVDNVFHIASLLSHSLDNKTSEYVLNINNEDVFTVYYKILDFAKKSVGGILAKNVFNLTLKMNHLEKLAKGNYKVIITFPVITDHESLITIKIYNSKDEFVSFGYLFAE